MTDSITSSENEDSALDEKSSLTDGISSDEYSSDSYLDDECSRTTSGTITSTSTSEDYDEDDSDAEEIKFCSYRRDHKWWLPEEKKKHKLEGVTPTPCDIYAFRLKDTILNSINPFQFPGADLMKRIEIEGYAYKSSSSEENYELPKEDNDEEKRIRPPPLGVTRPSYDDAKKDPNLNLSFFKDKPTSSSTHRKKKGKNMSTSSKDRKFLNSHFYPQKRKPKIRADDDQASSSSKSTSTGSSYEKEPTIFWFPKIVVYLVGTFLYNFVLHTRDSLLNALLKNGWFISSALHIMWTVLFV